MPSPLTPTADDARPSRDAIEQRLLAIWSETLDLDPIAADDTFVELGGDSIAATLCLNRIQTEFGVEVPVDALLLDAVSVRELADRIAASVTPSPLPSA
jgi:acyl carrier protein